jgi:hypothetical protein
MCRAQLVYVVEAIILIRVQLFEKKPFSPFAMRSEHKSL